MENLEWQMTDDGVHVAIYSGSPYEFRGRVGEVRKGLNYHNPLEYSVKTNRGIFCKATSRNAEEVKAEFEKEFAVWLEETTKLLAVYCSERIKSIG